MAKKLSAYNKHVQREMKKGRSMKQAAKSWDKKKGKPKSGAAKAKPKSTPKAGANTGGRRMGGFNQQKIFKLLRIAALAIPAGAIAFGPGTNQQKLNMASQAYFGYDFMNKKLAFNKMAEGWGPFLLAIAATYGIPKLAGMIRGA